MTPEPQESKEVVEIPELTISGMLLHHDRSEDLRRNIGQWIEAHANRYGVGISKSEINVRYEGPFPKNMIVSWPKGGILGDSAKQRKT